MTLSRRDLLRLAAAVPAFSGLKHAPLPDPRAVGPLPTPTRGRRRSCLGTDLPRIRHRRSASQHRHLRRVSAACARCHVRAHAGIRAYHRPGRNRLPRLQAGTGSIHRCVAWKRRGVAQYDRSDEQRRRRNRPATGRRSPVDNARAHRWPLLLGDARQATRDCVSHLRAATRSSERRRTHCRLASTGNSPHTCVVHFARVVQHRDAAAGGWSWSAGREVAAS